MRPAWNPSHLARSSIKILKSSCSSRRRSREYRRPEKIPPLHYLSFSVNFFFSVIFSRPPRGVVVSPEILHTFLSGRMVGAGSGIRTHAARKGHRLSRPAPLDPHSRLIHSAHGTQLPDCVIPARKTAFRSKKILPQNSPNKRFPRTSPQPVGIRQGEQ